MNTPDVSELLAGATETFVERNSTYGSAYERTGAVLEAVFGRNYAPRNADEWEAVAAVVMIASKLCRFGHSLANGPEPHVDSPHDCIVYAAMAERAALRILEREEYIEKPRAAEFSKVTPGFPATPRTDTGTASRMDENVRHESEEVFIPDNPVLR